MWIGRILMRDGRSLAMAYNIPFACLNMIYKTKIKGAKGLHHHAKSKYTKQDWSTNTSHGNENWVFRTVEERWELGSTEAIRYCLTNMMSNDSHRARMVQRGTITRPLLKLYTLQRKGEGTRRMNRHYLKNSSYQNTPTLFKTSSAWYSTLQNSGNEVNGASESNKGSSCTTVTVTNGLSRVCGYTQDLEWLLNLLNAYYS
jgi:hypothetical protein